MIELQGGDPRVCDDLVAAAAGPRARVVLRAERDGRVTRLAARAIGHAGDAARRRAARRVASAIDPAVGFVLHKKVGDPVALGEPIVTVHAGAASRHGRRARPAGEAIVVARRGPGPRAARARHPRLTP